MLSSQGKRTLHDGQRSLQAVVPGVAAESHQLRNSQHGIATLASYEGGQRSQMTVFP